MIKELRIDNYVQTPRGIEKIVEIHRNHLMFPPKGESPFVSYPSNLVHPLLITKEWMLKFKFIPLETPNYQEYFKFKESSLFRIYLPKNDVESSIHLEVDNASYCPILQSFIYVHQLQNLYFALTGTELQIL